MKRKAGEGDAIFLAFTGLVLLVTAVMLNCYVMVAWAADLINVLRGG